MGCSLACVVVTHCLCVFFVKPGGVWLLVDVLLGVCGHGDAG